MMKRRELIACLAAGGLLGTQSAFAQEWAPSKPITIIVPFPAGGLLDTIARRLGERMSAQLKSPVVIDNKPGANTLIGAAAAAKAPADGHTLLFTTDASITINPFLYRKMPYDASRDFVPVTLVCETVECLIAGAKVPASNLKEFAVWAKREGKKINYGSYGPGSSAHLGAAELEHQIGTEFTHVPYKGQGDLYQAMLANDIQFVIGTTGLATQYIQEGRMKLIAPLRQKRAPLFPQTATSVEQGFPGLLGGAWFGMLVPTGTPSGAVQRLSTEIQKAADDADFQDKAMIKLGLEPVGGGVEAMARRLDADRVRYKTLLDRLQLKLD
jgi:tripartite-type tricarboxylate transporter receptor subunit TctC